MPVVRRSAPCVQQGAPTKISREGFEQVTGPKIADRSEEDLSDFGRHSAGAYPRLTKLSPTTVPTPPTMPRSSPDRAGEAFEGLGVPIPRRPPRPVESLARDVPPPPLPPLVVLPSGSVPVLRRRGTGVREPGLPVSGPTFVDVGALSLAFIAPRILRTWPANSSCCRTSKLVTLLHRYTPSGVSLPRESRPLPDG